MTARPIDTDCYGECYGVGCWWCILAGSPDDDDD
jgi:hypothetical protein